MITNFFVFALHGIDVKKVWFQQDGVTCHTSHAGPQSDLLPQTFDGHLISRNSNGNWLQRS